MKVKLWTINRVLHMIGLTLTISVADDPSADDAEPTTITLERFSTFLKRVRGE